MPDAIQHEAVWAYECPCCYEPYEPEQRPDDGRCSRCDDAPNLRAKQSQFGAGLVVCIAKFSEHLWHERESAIYAYDSWLKMSDEQRDAKRSEARDFPRGDAAQMLRTVQPFKFDEDGFHRYPALSAGFDTPEAYALSQGISNWANAAGDHFFDLDRDRAPQSLLDLADLMIRMRNSHLTDPTPVWTVDDLNRVRELWKQSCLDLDRALGTKANWGEY